MVKYLISFPSAAMNVPDSEWEAVGRDAHAVIREAKEAGVYVFGGGIDETVPPVLVSANGSHVSRKRVAVIRSFEYSGLIQSREVGVLLYILLANIPNA